ncbi:Uncharacterised protein [Arcanobacterium haemolyticum]|uniref:hypothetical protein n=1 Tax=Arcanobacterium haemolyticum TaxID=28264 RepID=UPI000D983C50|nr:hypothetical protein [Arcanobacterium haemolyticum]SPT74356.1 Uncharacterised protein [Arcanobacterium haemolyticum]
MIRKLLAAAAGATIAYGIGKAAKRLPLDSWERPSFKGTSVSLVSGAQLAGGMMAGTLLTARGSIRGASLVATGAGAAAGYIDDHCEGSFAAQGKGFRGHLGALKQGKVTSGVAKIAIIGAGATVAGICLEKPRSFSGLIAAGVDALLIASTANLINLLDLRPGRALKASGMVALPLALVQKDGGVPLYALMGAGILVAPDDLNGTTMLGDLGANAMGAQLGVSLAATLPVPARLLALAGVAGLTLASEKVSFSSVIEHNRILSMIDAFGRP